MTLRAGSDADFSAIIERLGRGQATCAQMCVGVTCDQANGQPPRGLLLETHGRTGRRGVIVSGLNPGLASEKERTLLAGHPRAWDAWKGFWEEELQKHHPYFVRTRMLLDQAGETGPILWTDLAKCESSDKKAPPIESLRTCFAQHMVKELEAVPRAWPILALGRRAYDSLALCASDRPIVGVPHPSGAASQFHRLMPKQKIRATVARAIQQVFYGVGTGAKWIGASVV